MDRGDSEPSTFAAPRPVRIPQLRAEDLFFRSLPPLKLTMHGKTIGKEAYGFHRGNTSNLVEGDGS